MDKIKGLRDRGFKGSRFQGSRVEALLVFLILLFVFCNLSFALDVPRFYGDEVVVTAARMLQPRDKSPWNVSVISSSEIQNYRTVGDALRTIAGADSIAYGYLGSVNSVRLRGANSSQLLILVDGRRVNSPTLGTFDMGDLLTDNVERIEIVRAPLSAIYGSDAISGTINIITKTPKAGKEFFADAGSFGTYQYKLAFGNENFLFNAGYLKSDGFRRNSDYSALDVFGKINHPLTIGNLTVDYSYYGANKGVPNVPTSEADLFSASTPNDRQTDRNTMLSVGIKNDNSCLRAYQNAYNQKLSPYIWGASANQALQTGIEWQQNFNVGINRLLYGFEAREDKGNTTITGDHTIQNYAIFLQDEIGINEKLTLTAGIREDTHSTAGTAFNPRIGLAFAPVSGIIVRASAGNSFRSPTLNELYWNDGFMFGNPALKPEKSFSYELGFEKKISENSRAAVNCYVSNIADLIAWEYDPTTFLSNAKNIGQAKSDGVEFEFERKIGERGKGFINYTYQNVIDKEDVSPANVNKRLPYTPQNKCNVGLAYEGTSLVIKYVGERYTDLTNAAKLPSYTVADLKIEKKLGALDWELKVDNLLDEKYSEIVGLDPIAWASRNYPMPGRRFSLGVKWAI